MKKQFKKFLKEHQCYNEFCKMMYSYNRKSFSYYCDHTPRHLLIERAFPVKNAYWKELAYEWRKRLKEYEEKALFSFLVKHNFLFEFLELHGSDIKTILTKYKFEDAFDLIFSKRISMSPEIKDQYQKIANKWRQKFNYGHS